MFTVLQTEEFVSWLDSLRGRRAQVRIAVRLRLAEAGNLGDWKSVGGEVSEMRVNVGPGYRLYFTRRGRLLIVMLAGGDNRPRRVTSGEHKHSSRRLIYEEGKGCGEARTV